MYVVEMYRYRVDTGNSNVSTGGASKANAEQKARLTIKEICVSRAKVRKSARQTREWLKVEIHALAAAMVRYVKIRQTLW
jgi:hypothetical protein